MATKRYYSCVQCHQRTCPPNLFEALREISSSLPRCKACGASAELHLGFPFGLEAGGAECKVLHAFLPRDLEAWQREDGKWVTFYPFLVVMERTDKKGQAFWLPYWHVVEGAGTRKRKFGQWAPFVEEPLLKSLVAQAREKGYLCE